MATSTAPPASTADGRPLIFYGYWIVGGALVAQFMFTGTQTSVVGVFLKPMTEELGWQRAEFFYPQTLGRFIFAFAGFFIGVYVDRYGARPLMVIGVTILAATLFLAGEVTELWQWVALRGVLFILGAVLVGNLVVNVTISKWFVEKRGRAIGVAAMGVSLAGVVWPPAMTAYVDGFGWRAGWHALAITTLVLVIPIAMIMRREPEDHGLHPDGRSDQEVAAGSGAVAEADYANSLTRGQALRTSTLYLLIVSFGLAVVGVGVILTQTIPFLTDEGFSRGTAAIMSSAMSLPALVSKPIWGLVIERVDPRPIAAAGFALSAVATIIILLSAKAGIVPPLAAGYVLMGIGFGGHIPIQEVIWASYFGRRYLGAVRSVAMPFSLVIGAGAPLAVASYFDAVGNYDGAFYAISVLWMVAAALVMLVRRPRVPRTPRAPRTPVTSAPVDGRDPSPPVLEPAARRRRRVPRDYMQPPTMG
ncbi:MAG: MFS transporter [Dehalococcoidia bacterium]|jgi:sugar phosphate permease|nr:MFS transporter [Dehalococcoidia bacterium]